MRFAQRQTPTLHLLLATSLAFLVWFHFFCAWCNVGLPTCAWRIAREHFLHAGLGYQSFIVDPDYCPANTKAAEVGVGLLAFCLVIAVIILIYVVRRYVGHRLDADQGNLFFDLVVSGPAAMRLLLSSRLACDFCFERDTQIIAFIKMRNLSLSTAFMCLWFTVCAHRGFVGTGNGK